ncbi:hypothetical protein ACJ41O_015108 [Fusarium nematophilum]
MASLLNSPVEIRLSIAKLLPFSDLRSLSRVNKHFHALVEPALYAKIKLNFPPGMEPLSEEERHAITVQNWSAPPEKDVHRLTLLLRTLLARPELCNHIFVLKIVKSGAGRLGNYLFSSIDKIDLQSAIGVIKRTGLPEHNAWARDLERGSMDAITALVISMLPNLRRLVIWPIVDQIGHNLYNLVRSAALSTRRDQQQRRAFQHLREVEICYGGELVTRNPHDPLLFLYFPNIHDLKIHVPDGAGFSWPGASAPKPSNLSSLELLGLRESQLEPVLSVFTGLRSLIWKCHYWSWDDPDSHHDPGPEMRDPIFDLDKMAAALSSVGKRLNLLVIDAFAHGPDLQIRGSLEGVLSDMWYLNALQLPWEFAVGFSPSAGRRLQDVIPLGVEDLLLRPSFDHREEWKWDAASLLETLKSWLGSLTEDSALWVVTVAFKRAYVDAWGEAGRHELELLGAKADVEVIIQGF